MKNIEIEYKFWLKIFNIKSFFKKNHIEYKKDKIVQFYLTENDIYKRYRKKSNKYFMTIKKGEGLKREEFEKIISKESFYTLYKEAKNIIKKDRYIFNFQDHTYELDKFKADLKGLIFLEIEFDTEDEAKNFILPSIFDGLVFENVTFDNSFTNSHLSLFKHYSTTKNPNSILSPREDSKNALAKIFFKISENILYFQRAYTKEPQNTEHLHQLRINLRKAKSILQMFKPIYHKDSWEKAYKQISYIIDKTDNKRDIDVFLEYIEKYKSTLPSKLKNSFDKVESNLRKREKKEGEKVVTFLKENYIKNALNFVESLSIVVSDKPILLTFSHFSDKLYKNIDKNYKKITISSSSNKIHNLRIKIKRYRYALELFKEFFEKESAKMLLKNSKKLQDIFGHYQDLHTQQIYLTNFNKNSSLKTKKSSQTVKQLLKIIKKEKKRSKRKILKSYSTLKSIAIF